MIKFKLTPEFIEKAHWRYKNIIRKMVNERIKLILGYAQYEPEDLASLWEVDIDTVKRYMKDFTLVPVPKLWLLAYALNVWIDCFPRTNFWENMQIDDLDFPEIEGEPDLK